MTAEEISARAGVPPNVFYEHFRNEEDCLLASYRHHAGLLIGTVATAATTASDWQERTRRVLAAVLQFLAGHPDVARMGVVEAMAAGPDALAERGRVMAALAALVGKAPLPTAVPAPRLLVETTAGSVLQLIYTWIADDRTGQLEQLLPTCVYMASVVILGPNGAAAECRRDPTAVSG